MRFDAILFDFDGVIADSEWLSNTVLAEQVTALGTVTTLQESYQRYMGKRHSDVMRQIATDVVAPLPPSFEADLAQAILARLERDLTEVSGITAFLGALKDLPIAIASSSSQARLQMSLRKLGLSARFGAHVYSADAVVNGKPAPDIYLHAANALGVPAPACLVIEDSASGVRAGKSAAMTVVGFTGGKHSQPDHAQRLRDAGADHVCADWGQVAAYLGAKDRI